MTKRVRGGMLLPNHNGYAAALLVAEVSFTPKADVGCLIRSACKLAHVDPAGNGKDRPTH